MKERPSTLKPMTDAEIAARDRTRGFTDADLAEVLDNPEWTDEQLRTAMPFAKMFPDLAASIGRDAGNPDAITRKAAAALKARRPRRR